MADAKNIIALALSVIILAFVVENIPAIKNNIGDVLSGVSLSPITYGSGFSSFPVKLDAGLLTPYFSMEFDDVESITADSSNASIAFDDRQITISPSSLKEMTVRSYSGKLSYYANERSIGFDGAAKGIVSDAVKINSERKVKILGTLTSDSARLTNVVGGTIAINKATGSLVYNTTNSVSLLGDEVKISKFTGKISIGSYGVVLEGNAGRIEVRGAGKTVTYG
ncbi:MAG: hypothetical protein HYS53_02325 [Candidatus Aenigmarchaeota archaeon]|nr:hypothetical protein [Candidatus Aenigmarchaeota archaeon]